MPSTHATAALAVAAVLLTAGCGAPLGTGPTPAATGTESATTQPHTDTGAPDRQSPTNEALTASPTPTCTPGPVEYEARPVTDHPEEVVQYAALSGDQQRTFDRLRTERLREVDPEPVSEWRRVTNETDDPLMRTLPAFVERNGTVYAVRPANTPEWTC